MTEPQRTGGKLYDPTAAPIYFLAGESHTSMVENYPMLLKGVNDLLSNEETATKIIGDVEAGATLMVDSGAYFLASRHSKQHDVPLPECFAMPPEQLDGFADLWTGYLRWCAILEPTCWGYVEVDLGGTDAKRRNRAQCEARGLRPIPVYHPLTDPPSYFDELCAGYDRVAVGQMVSLKRAQRVRMMATLWERRRRYPHVWIHLLGVTPSEHVLAYYADSVDSSGWLNAMRWSAAGDCQAMLASFGVLPAELAYERGSDQESESGRNRGALQAAREAAFRAKTWRDSLSDLEALIGPSRFLSPQVHHAG